MKTTYDLPRELVREVKLRAVREGRKLREVAAELLQRGLEAGGSGPTAPAATRGSIKLPLFESPAQAPASGMSTGEILALEQEALNREDLDRLGLSL